MKKNILGIVAVLVISGIAIMNVSVNSQRGSNLSAISLANIEVLAKESSECPGGSCNAYINGSKGCDVCCGSGTRAHCSSGTSANCTCD